ncbi:MAG: riboflavin biosynthesis protein RibF, partial [candidate division WOR-3 bacterium]
MPTELKSHSRLVLALGGFDGVHLGHQQIISRTLELATELGAIPGVMTFDPLPAQLIYPSFTYVLTPLAEKVRLLVELGIETVYVVQFDQTVRLMSAEAFVRKEIISRLSPVAVVVGHDHRFGSNGQGDTQLLGRVLAEYGVRLEVVPEFVLFGGPVRSTRIRERLLLGDVRRAAELLGRYYTMSGAVVPGTGTGRKLGFPTINLRPDERETLVPADGVYVCRVSFAGRSHDAVLNIGHRPTFGGETRTIEAHLLDVEEEVSVHRALIAVIDRIRPERRFDTATLLATQIGRDIECARRILATVAPANIDT